MKQSASNRHFQIKSIKRHAQVQAELKSIEDTVDDFIDEQALSNSQPISADEDTADEENDDGLLHFIIYATKTKIYAFDPLMAAKPTLIGDNFVNIGYLAVDIEDA